MKIEKINEVFRIYYSLTTSPLSKENPAEAFERFSMEGFVDIHSHILPGIDDGSDSLETTVEMLEIAWDEGIRTMVATPHFREGRLETPTEQLLDLYRQVLAEAQKIDPSFQIYLGNELYSSYSLAELLDMQRAHSLNGTRYVLVEFSPSKTYSEMRMAFRNLQMAGYRPILAHAERYECLLEDSSRVGELINSGVFIQVNTASIAGDYGFRLRMFTRNLLKRREIHLLGTDTHNPDDRAPRIRKCMDYIEKKYGSQYANRIGRDNALAVLKDAPIRGLR